MSLQTKIGFALSASLALMSAACAEGTRVAPLRYGPSPAMPSEPFRASMPDASPAPPPAVPAVRTSMLPNGLSVVHVERHGLPVVALRLVIGRSAAEVGAARIELSMLVALMRAGTAERTEAEAELAYAGLGARHRIEIEPDGCVLSATAPSASMDAALSMLAESARKPRFAGFGAIKPRFRANVEAADGFRRNVLLLLFGRDRAYGYDLPSDEQLEALAAGDLESLHRRLFQPAHATLVVVGDATPEAVNRSVERWLATWSGGRDPAPRRATVDAPPSGARVVLRDHGGWAHTTIAVLARGPGASDPRRAAAEVLAAALGGTESSVLRRAVRDEHAAAYSYGAQLFVSRAVSSFHIGGRVRRAQTPEVLSTTMEAIRAARSRGIDEASVERARAHLLAEWRTTMANSAGLADALAERVLGAVAADQLEAHLRAIAAVTAADVRRAAEEYLGDASLRIIVEGDGATKGDLESLGLGEVERRNDRGETVRRW